MASPFTDPLWGSAAARLREARGWELEPIERLGRPREDRRSWLARGEPGRVIVKALANPFASQRAEWAAKALSALAGRGHPVPAILWQGELDDRWFLVVETRLPGHPLRALDPSALDGLLRIVDLQADPRLEPGGWDVSWYMAVVLFEGWERWWDGAEAVAPGTSGRLRTFLTPAWGHRLPAADVVHGDLNITNVLARGGAITGVVDWDHVGLGSRAADLTSLLFDWHRLRLAGERTTAPDGGERLVRRIVQIVGEEGLRCTVTYGAIARLALTARRGRREEVESWRLVTEAILDSIPTWR